jgi:uncharacterized membrane protein
MTWQLAVAFVGLGVGLFVLAAEVWLIVWMIRDMRRG